MNKIVEELVRLETDKELVDKVMIGTGSVMTVVYAFTVFMLLISVLTYFNVFNKKFMKMNPAEDKKDSKRINYIRLFTCLVMVGVLLVTLWNKVNSNKLEEKGIDLTMFYHEYDKEVEQLVYSYIAEYIKENNGNVKVVEYQGNVEGYMHYKSDEEVGKLALEEEYSTFTIYDEGIYLVDILDDNNVKEIVKGTKIEVLEYKVGNKSEELAKLEGKYTLLGVVE